MKYIFQVALSLVLFVLLSSCATSKKSTKPVMKVGEVEVPSWVYNIDEACLDATEICASAEGDTVNSADINAKNSLGSIFQTKIKSEFSLEKFGFTGPEAQAMQERVSSNVSESVNTILKGARIKERFLKDDLHFSLAVLDKVLAKKSLRQEIRSIDDQLMYFYSKGLKSSLIKMHLLLNKRNLLNEKYIIVAGSGIPSQMTYSKINGLKYNGNNLNKINVKTTGTVPRTVVKRIESMLTEMGYKLMKNQAVDFNIRLKYKAQDEYLNVKGFKKYSFSLTVEAKNSTGVKLGSTISEQVGLGRNKQDAFLKIKNKLIEDIRNNIDQLNIK